MKQPALTPTWPPSGNPRRVEVTSADDWWILAANHGRTDPWDIIVFNFETRDPNEVNWYLHHWVGCETSTDGKNFEFGGTGKRQFIYIPPADWHPATSADDAARAAVQSVLDSSLVGGMHVSVWPYQLSISSSNFRRVSSLVRNKRIRVRHDPGHAQAAEYVSRSNRLILSELTTGPINRSTIVHEAVHANFVYRRIHGVYTQVITEECFAYIVQMIYLQKVLGSTMPRWFGSFPAKPIWDAAWPIANSIRAGSGVDYDEAKNLKTVLMGTGPYRGTSANQGTDHDGI